LFVYIRYRCTVTCSNINVGSSEAFLDRPDMMHEIEKKNGYESNEL